MLAIPEVPGVFCDAHLVTEGQPLFLSLWGRDTAIQSLLARMTLVDAEGGLPAFTIGVDSDAHAQRVATFDYSRLTKLTARKSGTLFGDLLNLWLYDTLAVEPDRANARALLLYHQEQAASINDQLWALLKQTLWLPVLDSWQSVLLARFAEQGWIVRAAGYRVNAWQINLSDEEGVQAALSRWLRDGDLTLE